MIHNDRTPELKTRSNDNKNGPTRDVSTHIDRTTLIYRPQNPTTQKSAALCLWHIDRIRTAVQIHPVIPNVLIYVHAYLFIYFLFMISIVNNDSFYQFCTYSDYLYKTFIQHGLVEKLSKSADPKQLNDNENGSTSDVPTHIGGQL